MTTYPLTRCLKGATHIGNKWKSWSPNSSVAVPYLNWEPSFEAFSGYRWIMSPDCTNYYVIAKVDQDTRVPVAPFTWIFDNTPGGTPAAGYMTTDTGAFDYLCSWVRVSTTIPSERGVSTLDYSQYFSFIDQIYVTGVGARVAGSTTGAQPWFEIASTSSTSQYVQLNLADAITGFEFYPANNQYVNFVTYDYTNPANDSGGAVHFWRTPRIDSNINIARMAIAAGMSGITLSSTAQQVYDAAQAGVGDNTYYWTDWTGQPF